MPKYSNLVFNSLRWLDPGSNFTTLLLPPSPWPFTSSGSRLAMGMAPGKSILPMPTTEVAMVDTEKGIASQREARAPGSHERCSCHRSEGLLLLFVPKAVTAVCSSPPFINGSFSGSYAIPFPVLHVRSVRAWSQEATSRTDGEGQRSFPRESGLSS